MARSREILEMMPRLAQQCSIAIREPEYPFGAANVWATLYHGQNTNGPHTFLITRTENSSIVEETISEVNGPWELMQEIFRRDSGRP